MSETSRSSTGADAAEVPAIDQDLGRDHPERGFLGTIAARLSLILLGSVLLIGTASLVAYFALQFTLGYQSRMADVDMPNIVDSVQIARQSTALVNGAFRIVAARTRVEHEAEVAVVERERDSLEEIIRSLGDALRSRRQHTTDPAAPGGTRQSSGFDPGFRPAQIADRGKSGATHRRVGGNQPRHRIQPWPGDR